MTSPTSFTSAFVGVMEHDPTAFAADDHVGGFNVNRLSCKYDVFDKGLSSGWTSVYRIPGSAYNSHQDIGYVDVKFWCYTCEKGCPTCGDGVCNGSETCSSCATDCGACSPPPSGGGSCAGMCGTSAGSCWCDTACESAGDCCPDYSVYCGGGSTCLVEPCPVF